MAQFDVHRNPSRRTRRVIPYVLDVQADLLDMLATRVVVPLVLADKMRAARTLNPGFTVERVKVVMSTAELAGIPAPALGARITSLKERRSEIVAALDLLFTGA